VRIDVSEIGPESEEMRVDLAPEELAPLVQRPEGVQATVIAPVRGSLTFRREGSWLKVRGDLSTRVKAICDRCLEEIEEPVNLEIEMTLVQDYEVARTDYELAAEELDQVKIDGDELDLAVLVAEQIELSRPLVNLCRPDCRGLCPRCGRNLNSGPCDCCADDIDPRLAALKGWAEGVYEKEK